MAFKVRHFRSTDMDGLLPIERASFGRDAYDRKLFAKYATSRHCLFLIAEPRNSGAKAISGYALACICGDRAELANLISIAVIPEARRQGAATTLLLSAMRRLKLRGVRRLTLMVRVSNAAAIRFYERRGFTVVRRSPGYYEDREDGLLMRRSL